MIEIATGATPLESLRQFQDYHWLELKVFAEAIVDQHGIAALEQLRIGAARSGTYRGLAMHDDSPAIVDGRSLGSLIENWQGAEWDLAARDGLLEITRTETGLRLEFPAALGREYLAERLGDELAVATLDAYWPAMLAGVMREYGAEYAANVAPAASTPWTIELSGPVGAMPDPGARLDDPQTLLSVNRRTTGLLAAIQMFISEALVEEFDASGEETIRRAAYRFGADRGSVIRERILAQGKELTLDNFASKDGLQERDPGEAVFVYRDRQHLSAGAYYIDCTYCPLAEIWQSRGERSLKLAYLFDASNHRGLFQSYNPDTQVRWHSVKSRGDDVCRFRFTIPELMDENDPSPEEFDAEDPFARAIV